MKSETMNNKVQGYILFGLINMAIGIAIYISLLSTQLTNHYDGLWSSPYFRAGAWELSIGRWFWPVIDRLRVGYAADPFNSYLTIAAIVVGNILILDLFSVLNKKLSYLFSIMILTSTTVCNFLSYRYMSPTFGLSYLLSVFAAWMICKWPRKKCGILMSVVAMTFSLGLYQANLGCTCLLIAAFIMLSCFEKDGKEIGCFILHCVAVLVFSCLIYKFIWDFGLGVFHISAASYKGANHLSIGWLMRKLPASISLAYKEFFSYFFVGKIKHTIFQSPYFFSFIFIVLLGTLIWNGIRVIHKDIKKGVLFFFCIVILPIACNVSLLLAPEAGVMIQQTLAMAIMIPVLLCVITQMFKKQENRKQYVYSLLTGIFVIMIYGNIYMTAIDLEVMREGKCSTEWLMSSVADSLVDSDLYCSDYEYIFIGRPSDNGMFQVSKLWDRANSYAKYGEFWMSANCSRMAYNGVFRNIGIHLTIAPDEVRNAFNGMDEIRKMPVYPEDGSILQKDNYIVVKISNTY